MISIENVDDQNLLHNVVAVVLQLAQEVPSLRDEDYKDFFGNFNLLDSSLFWGSTKEKYWKVLLDEIWKVPGGVWVW